MNFKMLIFTGVMTALAGAILGLVVNHTSSERSRQPIYIIVGSTLGFAVGVGYEAVQQNKHEETD